MAMEPTGMSFAAHRGRTRPGGSSPGRWTARQTFQPLPLGAGAVEPGDDDPKGSNGLCSSIVASFASFAATTVSRRASPR